MNENRNFLPSASVSFFYSEYGKKPRLIQTLLAGEEIEQKWDMRREYLSPQYPTNWRHIPKSRC
ncbi:DUF4113 domain-containing protein [Motilimonas sp. KMU-193]|uniref:DUF4113 domain-containing protein n=1 Tax=Motilimonas sp. KMU-193 TaxID=3388668 RepID=UPI00396B176E